VSLRIKTGEKRGRKKVPPRERWKEKKKRNWGKSGRAPRVRACWKRGGRKGKEKARPYLVYRGQKRKGETKKRKKGATWKESRRGVDVLLNTALSQGERKRKNTTHRKKRGSTSYNNPHRAVGMEKKKNWSFFLPWRGREKVTREKGKGRVRACCWNRKGKKKGKVPFLALRS